MVTPHSAPVTRGLLCMVLDYVILLVRWKVLVAERDAILARFREDRDELALAVGC